MCVFNAQVKNDQLFQFDFLSFPSLLEAVSLFEITEDVVYSSHIY